MKTIWQIKSLSGNRVQLLGAAYDDKTKELEITDVETDDKIVIFLDDIKKFELQINKIINLIKKIDPHKTKSQSHFLKDVREKHPNAYKKWTKEELSNLSLFFNQKKTYSQIANLLGRNKGAIISRLYLEKKIDDKEFLTYYSEKLLNKIKNQKKTKSKIDIDESVLLDL